MMFARKLLAGVQLVAYLAMVSVFAPQHAAEHAAEYASVANHKTSTASGVAATKVQSLAAVAAKPRHACGHHHHHHHASSSTPRTSADAQSIPDENLPANPFEHEQNCAECHAVSQKTLNVATAVDVTRVTLLSHALNSIALEAPASGSVQLPLSRGPPA